MRENARLSGGKLPAFQVQGFDDLDALHVFLT
jgi:hypothetical protein